MRFDVDRFNRVADHFGRALYFLHFREKWSGAVGVFPSFTHWGPDSGADRDFRRVWRSALDKAAEVTVGLDRIGENQEAFYYQVVPPDGAPGTVMRATLYGGVAITFGFLVMRAGESG